MACMISFPAIPPYMHVEHGIGLYALYGPAYACSMERGRRAGGSLGVQRYVRPRVWVNIDIGLV